MALEKALGFEKKIFDKRLTKGSFDPILKTNAGNWMKDKDWLYRSNKVYQSQEQARDNYELNIVKKKHH